MDMDHTVYLSLGTNLGDRAANLKQAITLLPPQMAVKERSNVYETPPWGYTERRGDGGMTLTFTDLSEATMAHWHEFALEHLLGMDRRTRNLYDLRAVKDIPEKAIRMAVDANSDPSARNIRVAVVVADEHVAEGIRKVAALAETGLASAMKIFTDINEAEAWLARPLDQIP
jgi:hypothetical protein